MHKYAVQDKEGRTLTQAATWWDAVRIADHMTHKTGAAYRVRMTTTTVPTMVGVR